MVRAFLAVPLPPAIVATLGALRQRLAPRLPKVRWARPETLHLTLHFFGDVAEESLEKIAEIMVSVGRRHAPFAVTLSCLGAFPAAQRARVFWLGIAAAQPLVELHRELAEELAAGGFPRESRPFTPHLTLGRHRGRGLPAAAVLAEYADLRCGPLPVNRLILYESRLRPTGAEHFPRRSVPLTGELPEGTHET